jgi:hypothetical protein
VGLDQQSRAEQSPKILVHSVEEPGKDELGQRHQTGGPLVRVNAMYADAVLHWLTIVMHLWIVAAGEAVVPEVSR